MKTLPSKLRSYSLALTTLVTSILVPAEALAANLFDNPHFDENANGFSPFADITTEWSANDASNMDISGSLSITNTKVGLNSGAIRCVTDITAGESYDLALRVFLPDGQATTGGVGLFVSWYASANCTGSQLGIGNSAYANMTETETWQGLRSLGEVAPDGAKSARLYLNVNNPASAPGPLTAYVDDVYFGPSVQAGPPAFTSPPPPPGTVGTSYVHTFTASGTPLVTFRPTGLPAGLTLSPAGVLSGTPTEQGSFPITVQASNGVDPPVTESFTLVIAGPPEPPEDEADAGSDGSVPEPGGSEADASSPDADASPAAPNAPPSASGEGSDDAPTAPAVDDGSPSPDEGGCNASGTGAADLGTIALAFGCVLALVRRRRA